MSLLHRRGVRQFVKFGIVGASSTVIDWGIFYVLYLIFGMYYLIDKIISFGFAVINSFIWNRKWTFRSNNPQKIREFVKFLIIAAIGLSLNALIMFIAVDGYNLRKIFGLMAATAIVTFWNFLANKYYTFKESQA